MSESSPKTRKKRPNIFANVIAGSEEVVQSSFVGGSTGQAADAQADVFALAQATAAQPKEVDSPGDVVPPAAAPPRVVSREPGREAATGDGAPITRPVAEEAQLSPAWDTPARAFEPDEVPALQTPVEEPAAPAEEPGVPQEPAAVETAASVASPTEREGAAAKRRGAASRSKGTVPWAHQAVLESFASATIESRDWKLHGFRIVPDVLADLKTRMMADRRTTGNQKLAISHYLDAALRHTPSDVEQQIAMAQKFLAERMGMVEAGRQSTYRVGPAASALVSDMNVGLQEADYGRKGIYVVSAAIESFLSALDSAGELQRPQLPGGR